MEVVNFKDSDSVNKWLQRSDDLGQQAYEAMRDTSALLQEIGEESRGSMVDEIIDLSNKVLHVADAVTKTFEELSSVIDNIVSSIASTVSDIAGTIGKVVSSIGG